MIICFNNKINSLNKNFSKFDYVQSLMPTLNDVKDAKCPYCNTKKSLINYGHYERNISFYINNNICNHRVSIQRVQCKSCKRTHALLPHFVIPYVIMACFSIVKIVADTTATSAYKVYEKISLSYQSIYKYINMVLLFFMDFKLLNNCKQYIKAENFNEKYFLTNCIKLSTIQHRLDFFEFHNWPLFMQKFRNNSSPSVGIFISKSPPT